MVQTRTGAKNSDWLQFIQEMKELYHERQREKRYYEMDMLRQRARELLEDDDDVDKNPTPVGKRSSKKSNKRAAATHSFSTNQSS